MPFGHQKVAVQADISDTKSCLSDNQTEYPGYPGRFLDAIRMPFSYHMQYCPKDTYKLSFLSYRSDITERYPLGAFKTCL